MEPSKARYLEIASKSIIIFGSLNVLFAFIIPLMAHLLFPRPFIFLSEDQQFTGASWSEILVLERDLAFWMVLLMDTGRAGMMGFGILTIFIAAKSIRRGERWALVAVLLAGTLSGVYLLFPTALYFMEGLYNGMSGVSLGVWVTILFYAPWVLGLVLARKGMRRERVEASPTEGSGETSESSA